MSPHPRPARWVGGLVAFAAGLVNLPGLPPRRPLAGRLRRARARCCSCSGTRVPAGERCTACATGSASTARRCTGSRCSARSRGPRSCCSAPRRPRSSRSSSPSRGGEGRPIANAFVVAAAWTAVDWIRGMWPLGGFTWGIARDLAGREPADAAARLDHRRLGCHLRRRPGERRDRDGDRPGGERPDDGPRSSPSPAIAVAAPALIPIAASNGSPLDLAVDPDRRAGAARHVGGRRGPGGGPPQHRAPPHTGGQPGARSRGVG